MKKLMIVSLAVLCAAALLPQSLSAGIGIKGGYSWSSFTLTAIGEIPPFQTYSAPTGGVFFNLGLGFLTIQPEALYVRMGAQLDFEGDSMQWRLEYAQVPVLLKLNIIPAGPIRPFIYGGAYGSYLFNAKGVLIVDGEVVDEGDMDDMFEKFDYGVIGGAGITLKLAGIALSVEGRYNYGLANILTDPGEAESMKNSCWMTLVGFSF